MSFCSASMLRVWPCLVLAAVLAGCASPKNRAPVEERTATTARPAASAPASGAASGARMPVATEADGTPKPPLPGAENAGKPGYYTVKPGDTLLRIALEHGQPWREVVRWNNLENPNLIEVGQVLRVVPPGVDPNAVASRGVATGRVEAKPLDGKPADPKPAADAKPATAPAPAAGASTSTAVTREEDDLHWSWPASGPVLTAFEEGRSKGLVITGKAGDPVLAAADGRVVYADSGLRGYGNLVIVKHNNTYLTAYAHNRVLLVKEDQLVRRGQKIAEMGNSESERVQLHFEIRRQGKPIDPARLLPPR